MKRKSLLLILVVLLGLALVVTGCSKKEEPKNEQPQQEPNQAEQSTGDGSWERVQKAGKIVVGLDDGYPPMGYRDENGKLIGFDIDMGNEIGKRIGIEMEWMPAEWNSIVPSILAKRFDVIISGMNMWEERKKQVNFAGPYGVSGQVILVENDNNDEIKTLEDLKGKVVGTQLGSTGEKELRAVGFTEKDMKLYDKFPQAFTDLDNGRVYAIVIDGFSSPEWIKTGKYKRVGDIIGADDKEAVIGIAVRKEDKELLDKLNEALDSMKEDGTLTELSMKWIGYDITEGLE
ncbi:MAG: substrate-binding periplasmic protein [Peptococcales bacterium]|jgi:polar amino acid transport system substrate-binding protein